MAVYYGLAALVLLLYIASRIASGVGARKAHVDQLHNALIALAMFSVFALRSTSVGVDIDNYVARFMAGQALETRRMDLEIGYAALNDGIRILTSDPHVFLAIVSAMTIAPIAWVIGKTSESIYLSWILFMTVGPFAFMLSGLRQGLALAAVFATLPFLARRKILIPLLLTALAVTFHASALLFLPAIILYRLRLNPKTVLLAALAFIAVTFFGEEIVTIAISNLYDTYEVVSTGAGRWALANAALWLALTILYRRMNDRLPGSSGLYTLVLAGVLLLALSMFGTNVSRGATYYTQFLAILVPNALSVLEDPVLRTLITVTLGAMVLTYFFLTAGQTAYEIVPYTFKWDA